MSRHGGGHVLDLSDWRMAVQMESYGEVPKVQMRFLFF